MRLESTQTPPRVSSAKIGIYCSVFCLFAGLIYGNLESIHYPVNPFAKGLISFANALLWGGVIWSLLLFKQGKKLAPLILLGAYAVNVSVSLLSVNLCGLNTCGQADAAKGGHIESRNIHPMHRQIRDYMPEAKFYDPSRRSN
ncbi:MAG: hypothetical protein K2Y39_20730 [Candidatus Obscuribacterales bacterium]|nr:hypothetical protein [Candidatus Obscuribacterales bacterium]